MSRPLNRIKILLPLLISLLGVLLSTGCQSSYATFDGHRNGGDVCFEDFVPFDATFYKISIAEESTIMMLYRTNHGEGKDDIISVSFHGTGEPVIGQAYPFSKPTDDSAVMVGKVVSNGSCTPSRETHYLTGDVVFTEFSTIPDKTISGTISNGTIVNSRTDEVVVTGFSGNFSFDVKNAPPYGI